MCLKSHAFVWEYITSDYTVCFLHILLRGAQSSYSMRLSEDCTHNDTCISLHISTCAQCTSVHTEYPLGLLSLGVSDTQLEEIANRKTFLIPQCPLIIIKGWTFTPWSHNDILAVKLVPKSSLGPGSSIQKPDRQLLLENSHVPVQQTLRGKVYTWQMGLESL